MTARVGFLLAALVLSSSARADAPKKGAILVSAEGKLAIPGGSTNSGAAIVAGSSVSSGDDAHAEINLGDALVAVAPQTVFFVYGTPPPKGSNKLLVSDSTLSSGIVRVSTQKPTPINTPAGKVLLAAATDAKVHVESGVTRVSVHKGSAKIGGAVVADGFGVRVGKGKATKLPAPPTWTAAPKTTVKTKGDAPVDVNGIIAGNATHWHVQVAMNAAFTDFLVDTLIKSKSTTLVYEQKLPPGRFYTRVSALDGDGLEGPWGAVAPVEVVSAGKP